MKTAAQHNAEGQASFTPNPTFVAQPMVTVLEGQAFCAWCARLLGPVQGMTLPDLNPQPLVSHGICRACKKEQMEELDRLMAEREVKA